ncbi:acyl-CoA dehydrogenase C-terminal domain-containing protein [Paraglaciecola psychrophila]|jgi:alkylation response protein AidB-like acyl-CoA dehydrogenase|uniref:3-methylmercaptopropionyl-CoA dehydrogenase n=1 Tax=Paraglaciecola psychrophila 170 TaxID=1129794 RepID=K7A9E2_9ALTE|nr:acyl-CoA dehydrogenase C-terminal domain-containing protein [Paraglaciecola psychrophila]AGH43938.1 acyl-CoA dehydrogenase-like protein [Paraglaciecola psychrophila 170]GAC37338.1 acyl-CoA dehydrogenase [Paraglaciecola psychrophila 170]
MQYFKAPQKEALFVMNELLGFKKHYADLGFTDATPDMVEAIFSEAAKFAENVLAPINANGDEEGCKWEDGVVTTPAGFKEAYKQYVDGGWTGMTHPEELGGQNLPYSLGSVMAEWFSSANHSWAMYPGLSQGCIETLKEHGTHEQQKMFLNNLIGGHWTGTMCLTESHCGSDLGMLKCKAVKNDDGSYSLTGTKIFISAGEHDMSDNIVHIVIARLPDAPSGTKGISLFVVPKFHAGPEGEKLDRNGVTCGSIEHKMGIKGSATCVINFDDAKGYLVGTENRGLNCMFTFMNTARIGTGLEGLSASEAAFQGALAYAKDRLQFRAMTGVKNPDGPADPIINHPDVRRMLLTQKAFAEGNRALAVYAMKLVDISQANQDEGAKQLAESKLALLTPIVKAFLTETAQETTSYGMQVFGGHGFIREWGMEQLARDTRICTMYEGTTGIQAIDLLARKVVGSNGKLLTVFTNEVKEYCKSIRDKSQFNAWSNSIDTHIDEWHQITEDIMHRAAKNPAELGAASVDYLMYSGYVVVGYFWLQMAVVAQQKLDEGTSDPEFYQAKLHTTKFYFDRLLTRTRSLVSAMESGADNLMNMEEEQFNIV